jgi:hypothetical protein
VAKVDGQVVKVGDYVSFKSDVEQTGKIFKIVDNKLFLQAGPNGFQGDYISGAEATVEMASDCWLD